MVSMNKVWSDMSKVVMVVSTIKRWIAQTEGMRRILICEYLVNTYPVIVKWSCGHLSGTRRDKQITDKKEGGYCRIHPFVVL